ncbi:MAG: hypothetical protein LBW85_07025 [Deltaproteobacteria bacterium]|jgi:hypothetical protein|nr:hypothetical protein [Deltaproteobacteria bacterium]
MPEPTGRLVYWPLLAPWGLPPRPPEAGEPRYLSFPSWERYLAGPAGGRPLPDGLPPGPFPPASAARPLLAPEPEGFLKSLASLWLSIPSGGNPSPELPFAGPADPAEFTGSIRRSILEPPSLAEGPSGSGSRGPKATAASAGPGRERPAGARPCLPPELALALWTLGSAAAWEAERHLEEAAGKNAGLLDALKGPLAAFGEEESLYEAAGLPGLERAGPADVPPAVPPSGAGPPPPAAAAGQAREAEGPPGEGPADDGLKDGGGLPPAFRAAAPSRRSALFLRDLWLAAARPLLTPGDRLAASCGGFEGLFEGIFPPDPLFPGDFLYDDV